MDISLWGSKSTFLLKYSTLQIINRTELCECSLTASAFYIMQTVESCSLNNVFSDGTFTTYYAFNEIIFDTLAEQYNIYPAEDFQNMMESLQDNILVYKWKPLNLSSPSNGDNVLQDMKVKYETELDDVLWLMMAETEQEIYKDKAELEKEKHNFETFFNKAQMWERFSVICLC